MQARLTINHFIRLWCHLYMHRNFVCCANLAPLLRKMQIILLSFIAISLRPAFGQTDLPPAVQQIDETGANFSADSLSPYITFSYVQKIIGIGDPQNGLELELRHDAHSYGMSHNYDIFLFSDEAVPQSAPRPAMKIAVIGGQSHSFIGSGEIPHRGYTYNLQNNTVTDPMGTVITFGKGVSESKKYGTYTYTYYATSITSPNGLRILLTYATKSDASTRPTLIQVQSSTGATLQFSYFSGPRIAEKAAISRVLAFNAKDVPNCEIGKHTVCTPPVNARVVSMEQTSQGLISSIADGTGSKTRFEWVSGSNATSPFVISSIQDPSGNFIVKNFYKKSNSSDCKYCFPLIRQEFADGTYKTLQTYPESESATFRTDTIGFNGLSSKTYYRQVRTKDGYSPPNGPLKVTDEIGRVTNYSYYPSGYLKTVSLPSDQTFEFQYDTRSNLKKITSISGLHPDTDHVVMIANIFPANCDIPTICNKPTTSYAVGKGWSKMDYVSSSGQLSKITMGVNESGDCQIASGCPVKSFTYSPYASGETQLWLLASESTSIGVNGTFRESFKYDERGLYQIAERVTEADSMTYRECRSVDTHGKEISRSLPRANRTLCP